MDPLSLIIVEHDVAAFLRSSHGFVLDFGERIAVGTPKEIRNDPAVRAATGRQRAPGPVHVQHASGRNPALHDRFHPGGAPPRRGYGSSQALFGVSLTVQPGSVVAVLGANGAGKSTLRATISGLVAPTVGKVFFEGKDVTGFPRTECVGSASRTSRRCAASFPGSRWSTTWGWRWRGPRRGRAGAIDRAIARFPVLGQRSFQRAGSLSGGEQQMLALARALAVSPRLVIADEMSLGLAPLVAESVFEGLEEARRSGITIVLSEQFVHRALAMADTCVILTRGRVGWSGPASEAGQEVIDRYLGEAEAAPPAGITNGLQ